MTTIEINTARKYNVVIGSNLIDQIYQYIQNVTDTKKVVIVSDSNVWPLYGQRIIKNLTLAGLEAFEYIIPAGEESKNGCNFLNILNFIAQHKLTRSDLIIAFGGGVVGDLAGFVAATYLRGIPYIQVPTTLLSMVDSSVGGKTAIDLPSGKNLAGAFYQPLLVLCDLSTLDSLSQNTFRDGCAEVIKYSILFDESLFKHLESTGINFDREAVISRCIELKKNVVESDEFDRGNRQRLNLGHTFGHAVEASSNFEISHGQAVSIGIAIIAKAAAAENICTHSTENRIYNLLTKFDLPTKTTKSASEILNYSLSDKKRSGNTVNLIIPETVGYCRIQRTPIEQLLNFIKAGL